MDNSIVKQHENRQHALLSASSAHRWLRCTPCARLEEQFDNATSIFASEGTFMHELAELQLKYHLLLISREEYTKKFDVIKSNTIYAEEIYEAVSVYVEYVIENIQTAKESTKDTLTLIEQRVDYSEWVPDC